MTGFCLFRTSQTGAKTHSPQFSSDLTQSRVKPSNLETSSPSVPHPSIKMTPLMDFLAPPSSMHSLLIHLVNYGWRGPVFFCLRTGRCPLSALYCTCTHHAKNTQQNGMLSKTSDRSRKVRHSFRATEERWTRFCVYICRFSRRRSAPADGFCSAEPGSAGCDSSCPP